MPEDLAFPDVNFSSQRPRLTLQDLVGINSLKNAKKRVL